MPDALNEGARLFTIRAKKLGIGDKYLQGIPYFGSWQDGSTASGSIGAGGGHIDLNLVGYSKAQRELAQAIYREVGFLAMIRTPDIWSEEKQRWYHFDWQAHLHMVMKDCPHRTSLAKSQVTQWQKYAADGLTVTPDLDNGPRGFVWQTWDEYKARNGGTTKPASPVYTYVVKKGDTLGKIAAAVGVSVTVLVGANGAISNPNVITPGQVIVVPKPVPSAVPTVKAPAPSAPSKPAPKPPTSKPVAKPAAAAPVVLTKWSEKYLHAGARNRTVVSYEKALAAYLGTAKARSVGLTGSVVTDGYYGTATSAATRLAYRKLGVTPNATEPGPTLLRVLAGGTKATSNPAPKVTSAAVSRVDASKLRPGVSSRHVTTYQRALRAYLGSAANRYNPAGATGLYGSQTEAMTRAVYRDLARKQPRGGWTPNEGIPGPGLLKVLGLH
jgi:LysM repeat protein